MAKLHRLTFLFMLIGHYSCYGKHFRGGSMSWKPLNNGKQNPLFRGLMERVKDFTWICDDFDPEEDSAIGGNIVVYDVPDGQSELKIGHENCCWLKVLSPDTGSGGRGWNMFTQVDLKPRKDSGRINSSPVSAPIPLEKFYRGCSYKLQIAVTDPDNDQLKCRYMKKEECPDPDKKWNRACGAETSGLTVNKDCSLLFNTKGVAQGYHAVNIVIMDCPDNKCKTPYSKVPLLFLLDVAADSDKCLKPSIIIPPSCKTVPPEKRFEMVVMAEAGDPSKPISKITSQKPYGMKASPMEPVKGYPNRMAITLTWIPSLDQRREHSVCFSALDSHGYTSGRYCTFIIVTDEPPLQPNSETSTPKRGAEHEIGIPWFIRFNSKIVRPRKSAFIHIVDETNSTVYQENVKSSDVIYHGDMIEFTPPPQIFPFTPGESRPYTIQLDEGVAVPGEGGCTSEAAKWSVFLKDKTNYAILPKDNCQTSMYMVPPDSCDLRLKQMTIDNGEIVRTDYDLCCSCIGSSMGSAGSMNVAGQPGLPQGASFGPPGRG